MVLVARRCTCAATSGWRGLPNQWPAILTRPHQAQKVTNPRMRLPVLDAPGTLRRTRSGSRLFDTEGGSFLALHHYDSPGASAKALEEATFYGQSPKGDGWGCRDAVGIPSHSIHA
jgi:hypothetical protein